MRNSYRAVSTHLRPLILYLQNKTGPLNCRETTSFWCLKAENLTSSIIMRRSLLSHSNRNINFPTSIHPSRHPISRQISSECIYTPSPADRQYHSSRPLLSTSPQQNDPYSTPKTSPSKGKDTQNEPMKAAPFSELGATKTVKVVVIIALSIIGTMETIAYGKWAYSWWYREKVVDVRKESGTDEWWERSGK